MISEELPKEFFWQKLLLLPLIVSWHLENEEVIV